MCSLRDHLTSLTNAGVSVFGVSVQDVASHHDFAAKYKLNFPILADPEKTVTRAYGVLGANGMAERVTFVIGPDGKVQNIDRAMRFARTSAGIASTHGDVLEGLLARNWRAQIG